MDQARYNCSINSTRAIAWGNVMSESRIRSCAACLNAGSSPSGPPMTSATSSLSRCQFCKRVASALVVREVPRSSKTTIRQPLGMASSMRWRSADYKVSRDFEPRGSVLTALSSTLSSKGNRLAYSSQAVCAQSGTRWPTATISSFMQWLRLYAGLPFWPVHVWQRVEAQP